jgi:hypothetical protein
VHETDRGHRLVIDPLDLIIASMIAEGGEPDEQARAWMDDARAKAPRCLN